MGAEATQQSRALREAADQVERWDVRDSEQTTQIVRSIVHRVDVHLDRIALHISPPALAELLGALNAAADNVQPESYTIAVPSPLKRTGKETRLVVGSSTPSQVDPALIRMLGQAVRFKDEVLKSADFGIAALGERAGISGSHFTTVMRLGFLAPDIITAIAQGRQPAGLNAITLSRRIDLPLLWEDQRRVLSFAQSEA